MHLLSTPPTLLLNFGSFFVAKPPIASSYKNFISFIQKEKKKKRNFCIDIYCPFSFWTTSKASYKALLPARRARRTLLRRLYRGIIIIIIRVAIIVVVVVDV